MVSDAAKKKAAAKKLAAAGRGKPRAPETLQKIHEDSGDQAESAQQGASPGRGVQHEPHNGHAPAERGPDASDGPDFLDTSRFCQLAFPPQLSARQRAVLHDLASQYGLRHSSSGEGESRCLTLGPSTGVLVKVDLGPEAVTDAALCEVVSEHLHLDARPFFQPAQERRSGGQNKSSSRPQQSAGAKAAKADPVDVQGFVAQMLTLLEQERAAEVAQAQEARGAMSAEGAQRRGQALFNLRCRSLEAGFLGRTLLTLEPNKGSPGEKVTLPPHRFGPHDVVEVRPSKGAPGCEPMASGLVYRVHDDALVLALNDAPDEGLEQPLRLDRLANEVTYKRLRETLEAVGKGGLQGTGAAPSALLDVLFGQRPPRFAAAVPHWQPFNARLDASQVRAVGKALAAADVALIHGPPGTGKTTAVVELVLQEAARGTKVLAAAASNVAVDNLVERLVAANPKLRLVRVGHPARLLPAVLGSSLEAQVLSSDNKGLANDCRREMKAATSRLLKLGRKDYAERKALRAELKMLAKEERKRQEKAVQEVLQGAQVVCSTLTGVLQKDLRPLLFDLVVIDEAAQALEAACWSGLLKGRRAVLAGDHLQLPPTVLSDAAARDGLARTLFERLQDLYGDAVSEMLTVQYRMNKSIMQWSSDELYEGRLTAHPSVASHRLSHLQGYRGGSDEERQGPLLLVDTAGCDMEEEKEEDGDSTRNPGEARVTLALVQRLVEGGLRPQDVGVITPYNAQVALLRELRPDSLVGVEISSVDGFQGREKEAIIISMVRSNPEGEVGFLSDRRRMNVAVTRGRRHVALICDSETVSKDSFLARLVQYFEAHGAYISAAELVP